MKLSLNEEIIGTVVSLVLLYLLIAFFMGYAPFDKKASQFGGGHVTPILSALEGVAAQEVTPIAAPVTALVPKDPGMSLKITPASGNGPKPTPTPASGNGPKPTPTPASGNAPANPPTPARESKQLKQFVADQSGGPLTKLI